MSDHFDPPGSVPRLPAPVPAPPRADAGDSSAHLSDLSADSSSEASAKAEAAAYPWDAELAPSEDPDAPRQRHDAFTEARKAAYLTALAKTGCLLDACRRTGVSPRTVYRHQDNDPRFRKHCEIALRMSATPVEIAAWQRAVEGVDQEFACGGEVHVRRRYSDGLLRLLLQGSNPKKYGPNPGFRRKRLLKFEKKQIEREVRAEIAARQERWSFDDTMKLLDQRLERMDVDGLIQRYGPGWTKGPDGHWVPPGYAWVGLPESAAAPGESGAGAGERPQGPSTPRDSV